MTDPGAVPDRAPHPGPGAPGSASQEPGLGPEEPAHDPARRAFFLEFGKQAVSAVGQVASMADVVGRTSGSLAGELLGLDQPGTRRPAEFNRSGRRSEPAVSTAAPAAEHSFRSAYRIADDEIVLLDQRAIPEALTEVIARRGSDVAYYLRLGVARGGPLMAQVAAYGLALTARERAQLPTERREQELLRTERTLADARPSARLPAWAMERMRSRSGELAEASSGEEVALALRAEADAIAGDIGRWHGLVAAAIARDLPHPADRPLTVLLHGCQGALSSGLVGTGTAALAELRAAGRDVRVFVTEGRPFMDGARLASWELRQADIEHRVLPDAAVGWLFGREPVDAVLIAAEWIAGNGDVGALVGSSVIATAARSNRDANGQGPRVIVSGIEAARHADTPTGRDIPAELRPARELTAYLSDVPLPPADVLVPAADVVPADDVDVLVTEAGETGSGGY